MEPVVSRRRVCAGCVTGLATLAAGCSTIEEWLFDFGEFTVGHHGENGEPVDVHVTIDSPVGEPVLEESLTLEPGDWETWESVWERTGEHEISVTVDALDPETSPSSVSVQSVVTIEHEDEAVAASVSGAEAFVYEPGDLVLANFTAEQVTVELTVLDPAEERISETQFDIEPGRQQRLGGFWPGEGEYEIDIIVIGSQREIETVSVDGADDAIAAGIHDDDVTFGWGLV